jgi:tRNA nucleotidyltransferase/poly(A) polymerase
MRLMFRPEIQQLLDLIRRELEEEQDLYLVGGAVRDAFLDRKINDLDFAMGHDPTALAKRVAKRLNAGFFVLDDERHTARVLFRSAQGEILPLDFVQFTGGSLEEDLRHRDFTINAMAVSICDHEKIIDPLNGLADLSVGLLRLVSTHALLDDPVRVLRGIRLALDFGFDFVEELPIQMHAAAGYLPSASYERQRDEFFKILEGPVPEKGMGFCREYQVFDTLIPPLIEQEHIPASHPHTLPLFDHTLEAVANFANLIDWICRRDAMLIEPPWWIVYAGAELFSFSTEIKSFFDVEVTPGRSKRGLALLATLLHDIGKPLTMRKGEDTQLHYYGHAEVGADFALEAARRLRLSNAEADWIQKMVRRHMKLLPMVNAKTNLSRKVIYRFFKEVEDVGVAIALHSLADIAATFCDSLTHEKWEAAVGVTRELLTAWWEYQDEVISPPLLLDGNDLQKEFELKPGKRIGELLECLREAQAIGEVRDRSEAKVFIHSQISQMEKGE